MKFTSVPTFVSIGAVALALLSPACGGSQGEPEAPPPPPPPPAAPPPPPAPVAVAPAPPPAMVEAAPAPPPAPPRHHHGMTALFFVGLRSVDLKPEQKTAVDAIEADLESLHGQHKDSGVKLMNDIADGVAAGKVDHKKTDADVRDITKAVEASVPAIQDAVTRLYKTLDATQRKTLVASMREHSEDMHEYGMMGGHEQGAHEHGMMGGHEQGGPPTPPGPVMGRGPAMGAPPAQGGPAGIGAPPSPPQGGLAGGPAGPSGAPPPAQGGPAGAGMGGPHPGMNGPAGGMGDHHAHEHGSMLEKLSTELALTPEQQDKLRTKVEAQMKAQEATMKARKAASEKHMKQIGDAFEGEKFDAKKVGVGQRAPEMAKTMATTHIAFVETVLAILTPEQRAKFAAHIRDHATDPG